MPTEEDADQARRLALAAADLRVTRPRLAVLHAVDAHPHAAADVIIEATRSSLPGVSTQAVYDILHALTRAKLLRRIEPAGSPMRYETRVGDNHHHLVCRSCGGVVDVPCRTDAVPCASPVNQQGFAVDEAEITFWGTCLDCQTTARLESSAPISPSPRKRADR